jgi:hypothetical protein
MRYIPEQSSVAIMWSRCLTDGRRVVVGSSDGWLWTDRSYETLKTEDFDLGRASMVWS